ncbi:MAG: hypothetical protein AAGU17_11045 [Anaerolineaceae bacterium]
MTTPCAQEDRITRIEDAVAEIHDDIGGLATDMAVIKDKICGVVEKVEDHERVLRGFNGNTGIIAKLENSMAKIDNLDEAMFENGGLHDTMKEVSAYMKSSREEEKARKADKRDNIKWLWRLVVGTAITGVLGWILALLNMK